MVTVVVMGDDVGVFMGTLNNDPHVVQSDGHGLKVITSTGLLWGIGCRQAPTDDTDSDGEEAVKHSSL